ncbi:hypothetical protein ACFU6S_27695 [Streptomyces sp. NPDC057456]|uniref:hypothetical protein n=1 Tax=Streptomyces sp. NPDC057456 TaxID=3346139 RepID=UPI0036D0CD83
MPAAPVKSAYGVSLPAGDSSPAGHTCPTVPTRSTTPPPAGDREVGRRVLQGELPVSTWYS